MINMSNRQRLTEAAILSSVGVIISILVMYVPFLSLFALFTSIPYIIISARCGIKNSIMSIVISSLILLFTTNPVYALTSFLLFFIPAVFIGYNIYKNKSPIEAVSWGTFAFIITTMIYIKLSKGFFNIDIIEQTINMLNKTLNMQKEVISHFNSLEKNSIEIETIIEYVSTMIPSMLIVIPSIITSFINYFMSLFILKRIKGYKEDLPKFKDFALPGNIILGVILIYLLSMVLKNISWIYYNTIIINTEIVFSIIFLIQGICVYSYFLDKIKIRQGIKNIILVVSILTGPLLFMMSIIGVVDSIVDFRRIRGN
ncbi:Uncharacterized conserved protein YybS, DUF2232 family [Tepidibacter formicigenes DSM 15518]|uniref:Uncharacterized conserved protein YybS, DUF2232 family n=2 Tax=Tepidibacter TaxID=214904 RepID=A0A1M6T552_9FIRM|nr:Uncharacterized conserved protein YybS, DUF2232 family [Tepidibacter formicigenes DSM 15518]